MTTTAKHQILIVGGGTAGITVASRMLRKGYTDVAPSFLALARNPHTRQEIIKMVADRPLDFPPGEKWAYSNTGYFLLGMIVEKVTAKPYVELLSERIFKPLGLEQLTQIVDIQLRKLSAQLTEAGLELLTPIAGDVAEWQAESLRGPGQ